MEVSGFCVGAEFKSLPAGALFLGNRSGGAPLVCIKAAPPKGGDDEWCVILFPADRDLNGPLVAVFPSWFAAPTILHLEQVHLVLELGPNALSFGHNFSLGHIILSSRRHYMVVRNNHNTSYLDLSNGQLLSNAPSAPPSAICRQWSLQWAAPDLKEVPGWTFGKKA